MKRRTVLLLVGLPLGLAALGLTNPNANAQTETNLHMFSGYGDGYTPWAGLVQGSDGNFYGTTESGGATSWGTVFRISIRGNYTNLYSFT
ncbi:MAG: choice-of-anchor tandem repeat GloVer-containing protein, partial [Verrucomicrobiia bacterium]